MRESNIAKALETVSICELGEYTTLKNGKATKIKLENIDKAIFKSSSELEDLRNPIKNGTPIIKITANSTVDDVLASGRNQPPYHVGVLNFASYLHPGGGFITGAMAQEEALCHASTLYKQLKDCTELYYRNSKENGPYYSDNMAVSKTIFFRNSSGTLMPTPVHTVVVTSAAVNTSKVRNKSSLQVEMVMRQRMHKIIQLFIENKCRVIILGAFGCGVFGNNPETIAKIWKDELEGYGGYFDEVYFSIYEGKSKKNSEAFRKTFEK